MDDDGMVVIRARLSPEAGALVQRALEAAADRLFREGRQSPSGAALTEDVTPAQRRADALGLLAEAALSADLDRGTAGDRYQVVVHVDAASGHRVPPDRSRIGIANGVIEVDHGALHVSAETSQYMSCDAGLVTVVHDDEGAVLDVGRRTRTVPPAIRRALDARDSGCRFPGCTSRRCDAHHVEHWADGGATRLDNLVLLCRRHHRAVHAGGFHVAAAEGEAFVFFRPDGGRLDSAPRPTERIVMPPGGVEPPPTWDGTPFNVAWAIDVLWRPSVASSAAPEPESLRRLPVPPF
jgi:Domain of unknown function (DUF222)/HNH endonuclease